MILFALPTPPERNEIRFCKCDHIQDGLDKLSIGRSVKYGTISEDLFNRATTEDLIVSIYIGNIT